MAVMFKELCIGVNYSFKVSTGPYKTMASYVNVYVFSQSFGEQVFSLLTCLHFLYVSHIQPSSERFAGTQGPSQLEV